MTNKELCDKYPWLIPTNRWTGRRIDGWEKYEYSEFDSIPRGWRIAFGEEMIKELDEEMQTWTAAERENFRITDIKEKWGHLCLYTNGESEKFREIVSKYTQRSKRICIHCGRPARWITRGWYMPLCDICAHEQFDHINPSYVVPTQWEDEFIDIDEFYNEIEEED